MSQLNEELAATRSDLDQAEARIADLEEKLAAAESSAGDIGSLLGDLLGGGGSGDLGIEDLLGLLGGDPQGLSGLEDLLGGLLGGQSGDSGGLGSLLEGLGQSGGLGSCLGTPGSYQITDASLEAQVDDIARAVEDLRGLTFPSEIEPVFVSPDEMAERVRNLVEEGYPQAVEDFDTRLLVAGDDDPGTTSCLHTRPPRPAASRHTTLAATGGCHGRRQQPLVPSIRSHWPQMIMPSRCPPWPEESSKTRTPI